MDPLEPVRFVKHGCVCFESDDTVVYVDPYKVPDDAHDADLIVITHSHGDHYSPEDIERVRKEDTCFATTAEVARLLERDFGIDDDYISELSFEAPRIGFECGAVLEPVAAENKNHPVSFGFGLVLEFAGFTYYLSGDTDVLVDNVQCDVLFVVCDGIWNMPDYEKSVPAQVAAMDVLPGLWCRTTTAWTHPPQRKTGRGCAPRSQPQAFLAGNGKRGCSDTLAECRVSSVLPRPL